MKTFSKGGIHPEENKLSADQPIQILPLPGSVSIPISQHIGTPAVPVVERGEQVKTGQVIAKTGGFVSANIHASISGKIAKISDEMDSSGYRRMAIMIRADKEEQWLDGIDNSGKLITGIPYSRDEILQKILNGGIVGMGGATFPSHIKLNIPKGKKADVLIINGVECEPYLTADHRLMIEKPEELIVGIRILMIALGVDKAILGIENNKPDAIEKISSLAGKEKGIQVVPLKVQYPQGGEKQLIKALIDREVPSGKLPIDVGTVVHNVGTTYAVYEAVLKNKPLIERIVTVTGKSVKNPGNFLTRIGSPVNALIEAAGGLPENTGKVISGGPMMGKALNDLDIPVTKGTSGILILDEKEAHRKASKVCIRCTKCVQVCPMGLEPFYLQNMTMRGNFDEIEANRILDCIECGSCSYICPSNRELLDYIRLGKSTVTNLIRERQRV
ncbi:MAG: electron transport complex subunit RsxC [Cyclobacteriaceae bacterium]|nr:electron transport complex subunit RsxC [Cyclobacteriaceae bacterium]